MTKENLIHSIHKLIIETIENEAKFLKRIEKGIFYLPERALVYLIARKIKEDSELGKHISNFEFEKRRVDLTLKTEKFGEILIEFKIRGRWYDNARGSYSRDIEKLEKVLNGDIRIFYALIDTAPHELENDERIVNIEKKFKGRIERMPKGRPFLAFTSTLDNQKRTCIIGCWKIINTM